MTIINEERYSAVQAFLREAVDAGAEVVIGEVPPAAGENAGFFPKPTILKGLANDWRIVREEVFGPVLVAIPWTDEEEVIAWANDTHYGLAAYIFSHDVTTALNAAGRIDAYWERSLSPWDMAAGIALVREAGGFVTDLDGRDDMLKTGGILAGNEDIHRELLKVLKQARRLEPSTARPASA